MSDSVSDRSSRPQPAFSAQPAGPPKNTAKGLGNCPPKDPDKTIYLLDHVVVKDLASAINLKPFKVVAELLALDQFKNADEEVDFETASIIARKHGYRAQRPPPGVLVL